MSQQFSSTGADFSGDFVNTNSGTTEFVASAPQAASNQPASSNSTPSFFSGLGSVAEGVGNNLQSAAQVYANLSKLYNGITGQETQTGASAKTQPPKVVQQSAVNPPQTDLIFGMPKNTFYLVAAVGAVVLVMLLKE